MLKREQVSRWLERNSTENPEGLNPSKGSLILLHILEHDYVQRDGNLAGMVIGLSLAPTYRDQEKQEQPYTDEQLRAKGEEIAKELTLRIRNQAIEVPVIFALYHTQPAQSFLPGNFIAVGKVKAGETQISEWGKLDEEYMIFPSNQLADRYQEYQDAFITLSDHAQDFFPNYVSLVGQGRFVNRKLVELTVEANTQFESKTEVIQLTQYLGEQLNEGFPQAVHLNLYISSVNKPQALYVRPTQGEAYLHVYRN